MIKIGEFTTSSKVLRVTDPCYDSDTWCAGTVDNCVPVYGKLLSKNRK